MMGAARRSALLRGPAGWIATGFGSGLSPVAPGTAGSLVAIVPWLALRELPLPHYLLALAAAVALGVWACDAAARLLEDADPAPVVWDEFVGLWIALLPLQWSSGRGAAWVAGGFILFRIFDIAKPWPVSWADRRVGGGLGIMFDDVLAGAYAALVLELLCRF